MTEGHAIKKHGAVTAKDEQNALVKLSNATRMLAEIKDAPGAKHVMDLAAAAELYAKKAKLGQAAIDHAFGIKLDAERRLGEYLRDMPKATGAATEGVGKRGAAGEPRLEQPATLADLGVSKKLSAEAQRLVDIPDDTYARMKSREIKPSVAFRDMKRAGLSAKVAALPADKYRVIYADPPWKYGDERQGLEKEGTAAAAHYPTMPTTDICTLDIKSLAAPDSVLFMWATFPLLEDGIAVMKAWGFSYKTAFVWDKQRSNIGNYHDARAELLMIGTRGSCPIEIDTRPKQVQSIARGKHSAKPEEFRQLIDQLYPTGPRIELFRRGDVPKGWKAWGNEAASEAVA